MQLIKAWIRCGIVLLNPLLCAEALENIIKMSPQYTSLSRYQKVCLLQLTGLEVCGQIMSNSEY